MVDGILNIAREARKHGAKKIFVSSILERRGFAYRSVVPRVNDLLYMACLAENFVFMDQGAITLAHMDPDGLHPNHSGSSILRFNILSAFRTFESNRMTFRNDYDQAYY